MLPLAVVAPEVAEHVSGAGGSEASRDVSTREPLLRLRAGGLGKGNALKASPVLGRTWLAPTRTGIFSRDFQKSRHNLSIGLGQSQLRPWKKESHLEV